MDTRMHPPGEMMSEVKLSLGSWRFSIGRAVPEARDLTHLYDGTAWRWHSVVGLLGYSRAYKKLFSQLLSDRWLRGLKDGAKLLDAGVGTGALSLAMAKSLAVAHELHGVDLSPRMLARARDHLCRLQRPGPTPHLRYGDVHDLSYRDEEFDLVMCAHLLEHCRSPLQALREMVRVLRVGAPLLIVTSRTSRANSLHSLRWRYRPFESNQLFSWMQQAGLQEIHRYALGTGLSLPGRLSEVYVARKADANITRTFSCM